MNRLNVFLIQISRMLVIFLPLALVACSQPVPVDLILHNVSIINVESGEIARKQAVVINDQIIIDVTTDQRHSQYAATTLLDGNGAYLLPALGDAHVHIQSESELKNFLLYGVGLIVNMSGHAGHIALRDRVAAGDLEGPTILTVGPTLDGDPATNPLFTSVAPENADEILSWISAQDYDGIKIYQQMGEERLRGVVDAADRKNLLLTGHVSRSAGINASLAAGQRFFAHGEELSFEAFDEQSGTYDVSEIPNLVKSLAKAGATVTPMLRYLQDIPAQVNQIDSFLGQSEMALVPPAMRMSFDSNQGWFSNRNNPEAFTKQITSLAQFVTELTLTLQQEGLSMILGTDAGFGGAIPGYSVHQELESLTKAGLTNLQALQMATVNMGKYAHQLNPALPPRGLIKSGYQADLLLLGANPLLDITATTNIQGLFLNGRWYDSGDLANTRTELAARQSAVLPAARAFETALLNGDPEAASAALNSVPEQYQDQPLISADNCIFLGYRYYFGGNRSLAGKLYEQCAKHHPDSHQLWIHIARAHEASENPEEAIAAYENALQLNPFYGNPAEAINNLSSAPLEDSDSQSP